MYIYKENINPKAISGKHYQHSLHLCVALKTIQLLHDFSLFFFSGKKAHQNHIVLIKENTNG